MQPLKPLCGILQLVGSITCTAKYVIELNGILKTAGTRVAVVLVTAAHNLLCELDCQETNAERKLSTSIP